VGFYKKQILRGESAKKKIIGKENKGKRNKKKRKREAWFSESGCLRIKFKYPESRRTLDSVGGERGILYGARVIEMNSKGVFAKGASQGKKREGEAGGKTELSFFQGRRPFPEQLKSISE